MLARVQNACATRTLIAAFACAALSSLAPTRGAAAQSAAAPSFWSSVVAAPGALLSVDSLFGRSGKLRFRVFGESRSIARPLLKRLLGDAVLGTPGVYSADSAVGRPFSFIALLPFSLKSGSTLGSYRVGYWPAERRSPRSESYANPEGFIIVTPENQDTQISEHFRLRDFLTHDQKNVWPKALVLREELVDKLELVIADLEGRGVRVERMAVMSGFRTPQYNARGVRRGGRAQDSRHQFGDAADVFIDNNGDGRMDDLNRDGRVNSRDAKVIREAVDRVERAHPELVGGVGLYRGTRSHGPFTHVDVRGVRARWGRA